MRFEWNPMVACAATRCLLAVPATDAAITMDPAGLPDLGPERFGSNAVGLGGELTGGAGALLGDPHFPWFGIERFCAVHPTTPGRDDAFTATWRWNVGWPSVNTIAADSAGNAFYSDIGAMPNASNAKLAARIKPGLSQALAASRL
jgi:hypothetical protein